MYSCAGRNWQHGLPAVIHAWRGERPVGAHSRSVKFSLRALAAQIFLRTRKFLHCCAAAISAIRLGRSKYEGVNLQVAGRSRRLPQLNKYQLCRITSRWKRPNSRPLDQVRLQTIPMNAAFQAPNRVNKETGTNSDPFG